MEEMITHLKEIALSKDFEQSLQGLQGLIKINKEIAQVFVQALEKAENRFVVAEQMNLLFGNIMLVLREGLKTNDNDLRFWISTLIAIWERDNADAEKMLIETVERGSFDKVYVAVTILTRQKHKQLRSAILHRLKDPNLTKDTQLYFKERLEDLE